MYLCVFPSPFSVLVYRTLFTDISVGRMVGCVAVPLSLAILRSPPACRPNEVGLVTAAVSGVAGGLMGGTTRAVTGPVAAISLLSSECREYRTHGLLEALPISTIGVWVVANGLGSSDETRSGGEIMSCFRGDSRVLRPASDR